ncbi:MAG: CCA tRNA nucleotidyltransferase [Phycisphaeraceae bacterium]
MSGTASDQAFDAAVDVVRTLRAAGHVAYLAGGCVRDELLGLHPKDYDVATDATPDRVAQLFRNTQAVGEAFGVMLVKVRAPGRGANRATNRGARRGPVHAIEVATFRQEWGYADGRRPDTIQYSDAQHDAQRRDFTVNGLFWDPLTDADAADSPDAVAHRFTVRSGHVIDYVGGLADLRAGVLRAIGDPGQRFGEDYLRMLRAVRFAARFNFTLEERTTAAIRAHARHLGQISRERIGQEVRWMFTQPRGAQPGLAAKLIQALQLDGPTLNEDHADPPLPLLSALPAGASIAAPLTAWLLDRQLPSMRTTTEPAPPAARSDAAADALASLPDDLERWRWALAALNAGPAPVIIRRWRRALCLTNDETAELKSMINQLPLALSWPVLPLAGRKRLLAQTTWSGVDGLMAALGIAQGSSHPRLAELIEQVRRQAAQLLAQGVAPPPWLTGNDLIAAGRNPGPLFRRILEEAYDLQLEGQLTSRDQALGWLGQRLVKSDENL